MFELISPSSLNYLLPPTYPIRQLPPGSTPTGDVGSSSDRVEFSGTGRALAASHDASSYRQARVQAVREEIQAGTYETPERINGTVDRLLDVIG